MERKRLYEFIEKAKKIHGDKYDYSKSDAPTCKDKTIFICPIHGEFEQTWDNHINGKSGCPKCAKCHKYSNEEWIEEVSKRHNNKYDYSKTHYTKAKDKVIVICHKKDEFGEEHGEFEIRAGNHMAGIGCPKCAKKYKPTTDEWINRVRKIHGDKYDYSKVNYINQNTNVKIICPIHGEFEQMAALHLQGCGCPKCNGGVKITRDDFIEKAKNIHGDKYDYSKFIYKNTKTESIIICSKHGEFMQTPDAHLRGQGCPKCKSSKNKTILNDSFNNFYNDIKKKISKNIININGTIRYKDYVILYVPLKANERNELSNKRRMFIKIGYKPIIVFEDEYINNKSIVLSKISHLFKLDKLQRVMGRKCNIKEINKHECKSFLENNHIQGFVSSTIYLGAFYEEKLIAVMSFIKEKDDNWNLTRFASDNNKICCGVGGKLFKYFIKKYNYNTIKSFADKRWTYNESKNIYTDLGFIKEKNMLSEYRYIKDGEKKRHHKFGFRKQILSKRYGLDLRMTESEMTRKLGYYKIWDCGLIKYIYKNPNYVN